MRFGSLFAGIGGIDLGLERAGMQCRWQVEIDDWCRRVLAKHWPDVPQYADIRDVGAELEPVDLVAGGFPCQPFSLAGRRRGVADERWMWPEFARVVRLVRPRYVLVENVPGLIVRGLDTVLGDLAALGYDAQWECIPAAAVGAPHLRWRVFIVAHAHRLRRPAAAQREVDTASTGGGENHQPRRAGEDADPMADTEGQPGTLRPAAGGRLGRPAGSGDDVPDAVGDRLRDESGRGCGSGRPGEAVAADDGAAGAMADADGAGPQRRQLQPQRPDERAAGSGGLGADAEVEPERAGLRAAFSRGVWGVPARVDRLRGLGNAVVPQVAEAIGRMILGFDE